MDESLSTRLDEVEEELVQLLSLRSDDLQIFSSRQDQLLQSHYHSLSSALETARNQLQQLASSTGLTEAIGREIGGRWIERRNLKRFWVFCEEIQRQERLKFTSNSFEDSDDSTTHTTYQTPNSNDSNANLSISSLSNMSDLSLN